MPPETPFLLVDDDVLRRNVQRLADAAAEQGLQVRPHAKTHKCAQVADLQLASGAPGLSVATIGEAEAFAAAGFTDLFIAYPLWLTEAKATRLRTLAHTLHATPSPAEPSPSIAEPSPSLVEPGRVASRGPCRNALRLAVDSADGARRLARGLQSTPADVLVEIDSGMRRSGVAPTCAG
ncbi:MAG: alanine racemase, partial [Gordonia sp. (in: high G+C Gram-positive bacteria)]|uniref:alanine racemase n=1 Tax=Gordonia sp. (in: high G+C Gram-positive bacteria) TaxID=84139 RepID=UPI003BB5B21A